MKAPILTIAMLASFSSVPAMAAPVTCDKVLAKLKLSVADYKRDQACDEQSVCRILHASSR